MSQKECMERIGKDLKHPTVRFLREHMEKAGCPFGCASFSPPIARTGAWPVATSSKNGECVKRRALKSVRNNPYCSEASAKDDAIEAVWDICCNDTYPFDRAP